MKAKKTEIDKVRQLDEVIEKGEALESKKDLKSQEQKILTVPIPKSYHKALKLYSLEKEITIKEITFTAIHEFLTSRGYLS